jgi:hypothetical protein
VTDERVDLLDLKAWFDVDGESEREFDLRITEASKEFLRAAHTENAVDDRALADRFRRWTAPETGVGIKKYFSLLQ